MLKPEVEQSIEATYDNFRDYAKKVKGYMTCPSLADIKLWHEYLAFQREITEAMYSNDAAAATKSNTSKEQNSRQP